MSLTTSVLLIKVDRLRSYPLKKNPWNWNYRYVQSLKLTIEGPGLQLKMILEVMLVVGLDGQGDPWSYSRTILLDTGSSCGRVLALPKLCKTQFKGVHDIHF